MVHNHGSPCALTSQPRLLTVLICDCAANSAGAPTPDHDITHTVVTEKHLIHELDGLISHDCAVFLDVDECSGSDIPTHDCADNSANAPGSGNDIQQGLCRNLYGSYECYCVDGWIFNNGTRVCEGK